MISLSSLLSKVTRSQFVQNALELLRIAGFPVTDWSSVSPARSIVEANASTLEQLSQYINDLASSGFISLASGDWLDLLCESNYNEARKAAKTTIKTLRLTNESGLSVVIAAGDMRATFDNGNHVYINITGGTIAAPSGSTLDLNFEAETAGADYNITSSAWALVTPIAGVDVDELPSPTTVQSGTDEESDQAFRTRVIAKWESIGAGATKGFFKYFALSANDEITRVKIGEADPTPSSVTIALASNTGAVSAAAVTDVDNVFLTDERRPLNYTIWVQSAVDYPITVAGTVYVLAAEKASAQAAFETRLAQLVAALDIGATVSRERIIACIMQQMTDDYRNDLTLTSPSADITLTAYQVASFDVSGLNWVAV